MIITAHQACANLTDSQIRALRLWVKQSGGFAPWLTLTDIADRLGTSKIGAGSIMVSLEKKGLVRRFGRSYSDRSHSAVMVWDTTDMGDAYLDEMDAAKQSVPVSVSDPEPDSEDTERPVVNS